MGVRRSQPGLFKWPIKTEKHKHWFDASRFPIHTSDTKQRGLAAGITRGYVYRDSQSSRSPQHDLQRFIKELLDTFSWPKSDLMDDEACFFLNGLSHCSRLNAVSAGLLGHVGLQYYRLPGQKLPWVTRSRPGSLPFLAPNSPRSIPCDATFNRGASYTLRLQPLQASSQG